MKVLSFEGTSSQAEQVLDETCLSDVLEADFAKNFKSDFSHWAGGTLCGSAATGIWMCRVTTIFYLNRQRWGLHFFKNLNVYLLFVFFSDTS